MLPVALFVLLVPVQSNPNPESPIAETEKLNDLLRMRTGATDSDLKAIRKGKVFAKVLPNQAPDEESVSGLVHIGVPLDFVLSRLIDIETFKKGPAVVQVRKFRPHPEAQDLQSLRLAPEDIASLRDCRPKLCDIKLSSDMMDQIHSRLQNPEHATAAHAEDAFRSVLFHYLLNYLEQGPRAMITYDDKAEPSRLADVTSGLLQEFAWLRNDAPQLWEALEEKEFAGRSFPNVTGFYYWSREKFGFKAVVSMTRVVIWQGRVEGRSSALVASRQIYASHYFEGSLGLTLLIDDSSAAEPGVWVAYINRSRVDIFRGWLGALKRSLVASRAPGAVRENLTNTKRDLERRYQSVGER